MPPEMIKRRKSEEMHKKVHDSFLVLYPSILIQIQQDFSHLGHPRKSHIFTFAFFEAREAWEPWDLPAVLRMDGSLASLASLSHLES
jgi:hypothetical protein